MRSGVCPKCKSTDIYAHVVGQTKGYKRIFNFSGNDYYLCGACGYSERYFVGQTLRDWKKKLTPLRELNRTPLAQPKRKNDDK
jgi:predicted nucleic-acid-binding Zn-ribbon protein